MVGAITCGISASALWCGEGAIAISYPDTKNRGRFISIWQAVGRIGGIISGSMALALDINSQGKGKTSLNTYIVLMAIQCLGPFSALFVCPPEKLNRAVPIKTNVNKDLSFKQHFSHLRHVFCKREILYLVPIFTVFRWFETWQSMYLTNYFSVRVRSLNVLTTALIGILKDIIMAFLLDTNYFSRKAKERYSLIVILVIIASFFIHGFIMESIYSRAKPATIDWADGFEFYRGYIPYLILGSGGVAINAWCYWIVGEYSFDISEVVFISAILRCAESVGECMCFVVGAVNSNNMTNLVVSFVVYVVAVPTAIYVSWNVDKFSLKSEHEKNGYESQSPVEVIEIDEAETKQFDKQADLEYNIISKTMTKKSTSPF